MHKLKQQPIPIAPELHFIPFSWRVPVYWFEFNPSPPPPALLPYYQATTLEQKIPFD